MNRFELLQTSEKSKARLGKLTTDHGVITTPIFMPVGTQASVKGLTPRDLHELHAEIILANTYHLYLRPGTPLIAKAGGIHKFMDWNGPVLTDSGGFQVWSLKELRKITPAGVEFRSNLDGSKHFFSPESVMNAEREIGADIIMALDECTPFPSTFKEAEHSLEYTLRWTRMAKEYLADHPPLHGYEQSFFAIVQGGMPKDHARYVMGVGTPWNLLELILRGIDMFDCVMPTRNARNGMMFTSEGVLHYKAGRYAEMLDVPPDPHCDCYTCRHFSRAYMRHLFHSGELLAMSLASIHNLHFYLHLMQQAKAHIADGTYEEWAREQIPLLQRIVP